ncbi:MAG: hypothetical protein H6644_16965 [Caldilineaceae bacterium]|nr:hypothetical protein [Caldilineaceae bacterium]
MYDRTASSGSRSGGRLLIGALFVALIVLAVAAPKIMAASDEGTIPGIDELYNTVTFVNQIGDGVSVDICNQPQPYSDGDPVPRWANIAFGEPRELENLPNNNYDWVVTVAGSNCEDVLFTLDRIKLINGDHVQYTLEADEEGNVFVTMEVLTQGGGIIYLPIVAPPKGIMYLPIVAVLPEEGD